MCLDVKIPNWDSPIIFVSEFCTVKIVVRGAEGTVSTVFLLKANTCATSYCFVVSNNVL